MRFILRQLVCASAAQNNSGLKGERPSRAPLRPTPDSASSQAASNGADETGGRTASGPGFSFSNRGVKQEHSAVVMIRDFSLWSIRARLRGPAGLRSDANCNLAPDGPSLPGPRRNGAADSPTAETTEYFSRRNRRNFFSGENTLEPPATSSGTRTERYPLLTAAAAGDLSVTFGLHPSEAERWRQDVSKWSRVSDDSRRAERTAAAENRFSAANNERPTTLQRRGIVDTTFGTVICFVTVLLEQT
ncbi:unnamed protein product [Boreogadus saida]